MEKRRHYANAGGDPGGDYMTRYGETEQAEGVPPGQRSRLPTSRRATTRRPSSREAKSPCMPETWA